MIQDNPFFNEFAIRQNLSLHRAAKTIEKDLNQNFRDNLFTFLEKKSKIRQLKRKLDATKNERDYL